MVMSHDSSLSGTKLTFSSLKCGLGLLFYCCEIIFLCKIKEQREKKYTIAHLDSHKSQSLNTSLAISYKNIENNHSPWQLHNCARGSQLCNPTRTWFTSPH